MHCIYSKPQNVKLGVLLSEKINLPYSNKKVEQKMLIIILNRLKLKVYIYSEDVLQIRKINNKSTTNNFCQY